MRLDSGLVALLAALAGYLLRPLGNWIQAHPIVATTSAEEQALEDAVMGLAMVRVRVEDSGLRTFALEFEEGARAAAHPPSPDQAVPLSDARREAFNKANERLGELLRDLP